VLGSILSRPAFARIRAAMGIQLQWVKESLTTRSDGCTKQGLREEVFSKSFLLQDIALITREASGVPLGQKWLWHGRCF
jgi:hypothetical protein